MKQYFKLAQDVELEELMMLNPYILEIFATFTLYASHHNLPVKINSMIRPKDVPKHQRSNTHQTGRAIDVCVNHWSEYHRKRVVKLLNRKHHDIAAISARSLKPTAAVYGDVDHRQHIHLQAKYLTKQDKKRFREEMQILID